jgi:hypothetical protein
MSAFGGKADIEILERHSAFDPKQTCAARFGLFFDRQSEADDGFP